MPRRRTPKPTDIPDAVLDYFAGPARVMTPGEVDESMRRYKKALLERALGAELTYHLGSPPAPRRRPPPITGTARPPRPS